MPRRYVIFLVYLLAYFLSSFFRATNAVIADDLVRDVGLDAANLGLMTGIFFGVFALAQFALGPSLDRFGSRLTMTVLLMPAVVGALVFSLADSFAGLMLGRALIGLGMAGCLMASFKAFSDWFPAERFATVSGIFVGLGASGGLLASTPLALLSAQLGWRAVFVYGAGATLLSLVLIFVFARDVPHETAVVNDTRPTDLTAIFGKPYFWQMSFLNLTVAGSLYAYQSLWMGPYLSDVFNMSAVTVGNYILVLNLAVVIGYFFSGQLVDRLGLFRVIFSSVTCLVASQVALAFLVGTELTGIVLFVMSLFGFAGAFNIMVFTHARRLFPHRLIGRAFAFINFFGFGGIFLYQWLLGLIIGRFGLTTAGQYQPQAFVTIFLLTAGLSLISLIVYAPLARQKPA